MEGPNGGVQNTASANHGNAGVLQSRGNEKCAALERGDSGVSAVTASVEPCRTGEQRTPAVVTAPLVGTSVCSSSRDLSPSELESLLEEEFTACADDDCMEVDDVGSRYVSWDELDVIMGQKELNAERDAEAPSENKKH
mmetsp:Transcript_12496/g.33722  ORF Transcript_12496/g.33722 Transcript_12496/m.33722 type:complete len:139 (+) Transcript_12496:587-1003(+)|eukprot:CAMPEP_0185830908 /NCGR_PEP_ID=MMETSP1353-20130828/1159_1 /TAXON_ID=1077150 /ORGANISM="Erythrolobus australicus, Strain CCMP3124" /LENGTH=138 /DNA_ID=CAMNT_0028528901 /DNA_START=587 /DNA_END=1003 /DNA_ORIENTATION=-